MLMIPKGVSRLADLAGSGERYSHSAILMEREEGGWFRLVASNGCALAIMRGDGAAGEAPSLEAPDDASKFLMPLAGWSEAMSLGGRKGKPDVAFALGKQEAHFLSGSSLGKALTEQGPFPDYRHVLARLKVPLVQFTVDARLLARICQVFASLPGNKGELARLTLCYYPGKEQPVGLMGEAGGVFFDALLMPLE